VPVPVPVPDKSEGKGEGKGEVRVSSTRWPSDYLARTRHGRFGLTPTLLPFRISSTAGESENTCHGRCLENKKPLRKLDFSIRAIVDQDPTMAMLAMNILVHLWVIYWGTEPSTLAPRSNVRHHNTASAVGYVTIVIHTLPHNHRRNL
jgi:hypothetical protein